MRAGAGTATVELGGVLPFDGFDEVRHPLRARALVVEAPGGAGWANRVCLVSLEVTSMREGLVRAARDVVERETGCAGPRAWLCATHTFSAPHVRTPAHLSSDEERTRNTRLCNAYLDAVRTAARRAVDTLVPATLEVGEGTCSVNVNRDVETPSGWWLGVNDSGFSDHALPVLRFRSSDDGSPVAVLFSADVASSVLDGSRTSEGRRVVSADLVGFAAARLERESPSCPVLFLTGAAGDQAPLERAVRHEVTASGEVREVDAHEEGYRMLHQQGALLADDVRDALCTACEVPCDLVDAVCRTVTYPGQARPAARPVAPSRSWVSAGADSVATTLYALRLGPVTLAGFEPELSSATGAAIRGGVGSPAIVATMVNGAQKYLPEASAYDRGTYEAMSSGFARGTADCLTRDALGLFGELSERSV